MKIYGKKGRIVFFLLILSGLTQVLSIYQSRYLAAGFGAGNQLDAYYLDTNISAFLFSFLMSGITTVLIPAYAQEKEEAGIQTFITVTYTVTFLFAGILALSALPVLSVLSNRGTAYAVIAASYLPLCLLGQGIGSVSAVTAAYYQCEGIFLLPKSLAFLANLALTVVLVLNPGMDLFRYLMISLICSAVRFALDLSFCIRFGFRYHPRLLLKNRTFLELLQIFWPTMISSGVYKLQMMLDTEIANILPKGQLSALSYALSVTGIVNGAVIGNLMLFLYPQIARRAKNGNDSAFLWDLSRHMHALICYLGVCFVLAGKELIFLLFHVGKMDAASLEMVFYCACIYLAGSQTNVVRDLLYRYFYVQGNTKTVSRNSVAVSILNITLSILLVFRLKVYGLVLGTVLAGVYSLWMIGKKFKRAYAPDLQYKKLLPPYLCNEGISLIVGGGLLAAQHFFLHLSGIRQVLIMGILASLCFGLLYFLSEKIFAKRFRSI